MPTDRSSTPKQKLRWYHPTPGWLLVVLLAVEGGLLLSKPWFPKGWAVLIAVAAVGVFLLFMLLWLAIVLLFRWRFQFSIRSLLLLTVAVAVPCSWLGVEMKWAEKQMKAVKALAKRDGESLLCVIGYEDFKYSTFPAITGGSPLGSSSSRLRKVFGDDFFDNATHVCFFGDRLTDAKLDHLKELPHIQQLSLYVDQLTDADLARLKGLTQLHELDLIATNVTDAGVAKLQRALPNCRVEQ
jgi:hypothetical protein